MITAEDQSLISRYRNDWNVFIREVLGVKLDGKQQEIVTAVQNNRRVSVRSGHARGKDMVLSCCALCWLYLIIPSKVILTGPTGRQVISIQMAQLGSIYQGTSARLGKHGLSLGGRLLHNKIVFHNHSDHFLEAFKAGDRAPESWQGFHSPNIFVGVTEASGLDDACFNAMEGLLTGNSRLFLVGNPIRNEGEFYQSFSSPLYTNFVLSCLHAPNVKSNKNLYSGQVDRLWVDEHVKKPGWTRRVSTTEANPDLYFDFRWDGQWYRPSDLCLVKVLGEFPRQSESSLIPLYWIERSYERWWELQDNIPKGFARLGVDVAGMGVDLTVLFNRIDNYVCPPEVFVKQDHMATVGKIINRLKEAPDGAAAYVDAQGEGSGVYSRLRELGASAVPVKFAGSAKGLRDFTGEKEFVNKRSYCYWAFRDNLDPDLGGRLALPPGCPELAQDLMNTTFRIRSDGKIILDEKSIVKARLGRSPDYADSIAGTYDPKQLDVGITEDVFEGIGAF